jgi:PAS domain S-box-containing protein
MTSIEASKALVEQLHQQVSHLQQANAHLQTELAQLRQENERLHLETTRSPTEATVSPTNLYDRLLEASAIAANALLTTDNFDEAINTAQQIIGEALETDRVTVIENFDHSSDQLFLSWRILYEWDSPDAVSQLDHPDSSQGTWTEDMEEWYRLLSQGRAISHRLEDIPEPLFTALAEVGVKATHIIPIFVEGQYWGQIGFDDCCDAKYRSPAELSALRIIADCIGSAIQRDRTQKAILQAEQARSQELERLNTELQQTLDRLAKSEKRYRTLFELGMEGFNYVEFEPPFSTALPIEEQIKLYRQNLVIKKVNPAFAAMYGIDNPDEIVGLKLADFHVEDSETNTAFIRTGIESGYRWHNSETEEINAHGKIRYFVNTGFVNINEDGYAVSGWGTQIDITELREAQQALLQAERDRNADLERLNTELQQTLDRLSESEERYRTLFEISSEGIFRVEFDQPIPLSLPIDEQVELIYRRLKVVEANSTYAAMYGKDNPEDLIGLRLTDIHVAESEQNHAMMRKLVENSYQLRNAETEEVDFDGNPRYFLNNITQIIKDGCAIGGWASQLDITELRLTQQALLQAEKDRAAELVKTNEALKQSLDALATEPDLDKFLGHVLQAIAQQFQSPLTEYWYHSESGDVAYIGLSYYQGTLLTPDKQPGHPGAIGIPIPPQLTYDEALNARQRYIIYQGIGTEHDNAGQWMSEQMGMDVSRWYTDRGVTQYLSLPLNLGERTIGALAVYLPSDRTINPEQIELAQALAHQVTLAVQLTQLATQARESAVLDERNRIAREIHDTLAQAFTGISVQLSVAQRIAPQDPDQAWNIIDRVTKLAQKGLTEARRSVWEICPNADEYRDLVHNIQQEIDQITAHSLLKITLHVHGTPRLLPPELGMNLLRIAQESITNTLRHAQANTLAIDLSFEPTALHLHIRDDGCGFEPKYHLDCGGFGLMAMQQRCDRFGGQFTLISQPGNGTEILIHIQID